MTPVLTTAPGGAGRATPIVAQNTGTPRMNDRKSWSGSAQITESPITTPAPDESPNVAA